MAKQLNAQKIAQKYQQRVASSSQEYKDGIQNVVGNPCTKAASQKSVWLQNTTASADAWADALNKVSESEWKQAATNGAAAYSASAGKGAAKIGKFFASFIPVLSGIQSQLEQMPRGSLSQNMQRLNFVVQSLHDFRYKGRQV